MSTGPKPKGTTSKFPCHLRRFTLGSWLIPLSGVAGSVLPCGS